MSTVSSGNKRDSVRSQKDFFLNSIKETDQKIKQLFDNIIEERKNTQKYLKDNYDRVVTPTSNANNISFPSAGKGSIKFESRKASSGTKNRHSFNTSAMLGENDKSAFSALGNNEENDYNDEFGTGFTRNSSARKSLSAKKSNLKKVRKFDLDQDNVLTVSNDNSANKQERIRIEENYLTLGAGDTENLLTNDFNTSMGSPIDPSKLMKSNIRASTSHLRSSGQMKSSIMGVGGTNGSGIKNLGSSNKKRRSANKYDDDDDDDELLDEEDVLVSDNRLLDTLKSDDFTLANTVEIGRKSAQANKDLPSFQLSKTELNFGTLYPTENCDLGFEIFNKVNRDLEFEVQLIGGDYNAFLLKIGKSTSPEQKQYTSITKFSFVTVEVIAKTSLYGQENRQLNAQIRVVADNKEQIVNLVCKVEKPSIQMMNSCVERLVGQVPFINFDQGNMSDSRMQIMFKNNGSRQVQLEIEVVEDPRLTEVLFSPKYLTIPQDQEKSLVIRAVSQYEQSAKRKAVLKYKIRGTKLFHCVVIQFGN